MYGAVYYCTIQEIDIPRPGVVVDRDIRDGVIAHLDDAIEKHWIQVYYQPVIRTMTGELCGMEALARWVDLQIDFLSPGSFIPVLEQVRLIHRLDAFVLFSVKQFSSFSSSKFPIVIVGKSPLSAGLVRKQVPLLHPAA